jgi:signal transduction histidine kinase
MNTQGIGLGLVISENIVKSFDGRIGIKSKYGSGSMFTFSIILGKDIDFKDIMKQDIILQNQEKVLDQPSNRTVQQTSSYTGSARIIKNSSDLNSMGS